MAMNERAYSKYFKAFGDPTRLKILGLLVDNELSVNDITKAVGLSQPTVSRHLAILREAEVVADRRDGQQVFYRLNKITVKSCCEGFCDCLEIRGKSHRRVKKK